MSFFNLKKECEKDPGQVAVVLRQKDRVKIVSEGKEYIGIVTIIKVDSKFCLKGSTGNIFYISREDCDGMFMSGLDLLLENGYKFMDNNWFALKNAILCI